MTLFIRSFYTPRPIPFLLILAVLATGCQPDAAPTPPPTEPVSGVPDSETRIAIDVGIVVNDMGEALGFYRDVIGLPVVAEVRTSLIGAGTMVQLSHGASLIKLLEMDEPPAVESPAGITGAYGHRYITLMVEEIDPVVSKLEQAGTPVAMDLTELGNGAKIIMVEDPDGNIVEFVQEAP